MAKGYKKLCNYFFKTPILGILRWVVTQFFVTSFGHFHAQQGVFQCNLCYFFWCNFTSLYSLYTLFI